MAYGALHHPPLTPHQPHFYLFSQLAISPVTLDTSPCPEHFAHAVPSACNALPSLSTLRPSSGLFILGPFPMEGSSFYLPSTWGHCFIIILIGEYSCSCWGSVSLHRCVSYGWDVCHSPPHSEYAAQGPEHGALLRASWVNE